MVVTSQLTHNEMKNEMRGGKNFQEMTVERELAKMVQKNPPKSGKVKRRGEGESNYIHVYTCTTHLSDKVLTLIISGQRSLVLYSTTGWDTYMYNFTCTCIIRIVILLLDLHQWREHYVYTVHTCRKLCMQSFIHSFLVQILPNGTCIYMHVCTYVYVHVHTCRSRMF